jgi:hypothetical protein
MSEPRLTEERLRTWVLNQSDRERLCLAILSLDSRFADVKPRRPKGGPDGARDIEAVFQNREKVWGAVGFRANARDDSEDKRWVQTKFRADVAAAKEENQSLWGFVFFTNIDLTPEEVMGLEQYGRTKGLSFVEVYWRERLRIELDAPRGLSFRYQYLSIDLSPAEQRVFFAEYGQALERLLQRGFSAIDDRLRRLEFLQECQKQLVNASVVVTLLRPVSAEELGHYRFLAEIRGQDERDPRPTLCIGGRDGYWSLKRDDSTVLLTGTRSLAWCRNPDESLQNTTIGGELTTKQLEGWVHLVNRGPFSTLSNLERTIVILWVSKPLLPCFESIFLIVNGYALAGGRQEQLRIREEGPAPAWLETLTEDEAKIPWVTVLQRMHDRGTPPGLDFSPWYLDFSQSTPPKVQERF